MNKSVFIFFAIGCIFFIGYLLVSTKKSNEANLRIQFNGIIQSVNYDEKGIPSIEVNAKKFYLDAGYNFEYKIQKGDSLRKQKDSNIYELIKPTGEVIKFKN